MKNKTRTKKQQRDLLMRLTRILNDRIPEKSITRDFSKCKGFLYFYNIIEFALCGDSHAAYLVQINYYRMPRLLQTYYDLGNDLSI